MKLRLEPTLMALAATAFAVSTVAMSAGLEPFATWYYSLAWWSYIVFMDAWIAGRDPAGTLIRNPEAIRMMALSVVIWVSFEAYNFRLGNWSYLALPAARTERWLGYTVAYATVLPGILVTSSWLERVFPPRVRPLPPPSRTTLSTLLWVGATASLLPLFWPRTFFPLVWLGPTALFAVVNYHLGGQGILKELESRGPARLIRLVAAGGICGFLWEIWNFWATSKWTYDIPFLDALHVFEMPLAGFLGFLPFAVECHEMYWVGRKVLDRARARSYLRWIVWLVLALYVAVVFWGIDQFTVRTYQNGIRFLPPSP